MRPPHFLQAPPSSSQLNTGTLSQLAIGSLHWRQCDRGHTTDSPAGNRRMQTLRKLPSSKPHNPKKIQPIMASFRRRICQPNHSNRSKVILKPIVYIGGMSPERDPAADSAVLFAEAVSIMARLRGADGCPWDREQSFDTIRKYTLEECYEVLDAIERRHWNDLCEELGDLLLQVLFYAQMASEPGYF